MWGYISLVKTQLIEHGRHSVTEESKIQKMCQKNKNLFSNELQLFWGASFSNAFGLARKEGDDQLPIVKQLVISIERKPQFFH